MAGASGLALEFWILLPPRFKIKNSKSLVYSSLYGKLVSKDRYKTSYWIPYFFLSLAIRQISESWLTKFCDFLQNFTEDWYEILQPRSQLSEILLMAHIGPESGQFIRKLSFAQKKVNSLLIVIFLHFFRFWPIFCYLLILVHFISILLQKWTRIRQKLLHLFPPPIAAVAFCVRILIHFLLENAASVIFRPIYQKLIL